jgi:hypothetical protein
VPGDCRIDSDCGPAGYCSPSSTIGGCGTRLAGYYCRTSDDQCLNDGDCSVDAGPGGGVCAYSTAKMRWECATVGLCP